MAIPIAYNLRNLVVRKTTTLMTALGIALTVAVLLAVLALVNGLRVTLGTSGDPLHVLVLRKGSESELVSHVHAHAVSGSEVQARHRHRPRWPAAGVAGGGHRHQSGQRGQSQRRQRHGARSARRPASRCGAMCTSLAAAGSSSGQREVVVGKSVAKRFPDGASRQESPLRPRRLGDRGRDGRRRAARQDSEIWGDLDQVTLRPATRRNALLGAGRGHRRGDRAGAGQRPQRRSAAGCARHVRKGILRAADRAGRAHRIHRACSWPSSWRWAAASPP